MAPMRIQSWSSELSMNLRPASAEELARSLRDASQSVTRIGCVDLSALSRILEHTPEDMTVTVEAGATLAALQRSLAARGQWLPIDPPHPDRLTLAVLLDTNASGPRRAGFGTIRDYVIGLRVALADGRLVRSGGKVVKNVAGYDLMKLFIGACGTLGVIVEATFKLLPLPETEAFLQIPCQTLEEAERLITAVLDSELTPTVFDLHASTLQRSNASTPTLILGFSGARAAVDWQLDRARSLGFTESTSLDYDAAFHAPDLPPPHRLSVLPSRVIETLCALGDAPFVSRVMNGAIYHRGAYEWERRAPARREPAGYQRAEQELGAPSELPRKLIDRVKATFDPRGVLPDFAV